MSNVKKTITITVIQHIKKEEGSTLEFTRFAGRMSKKTAANILAEQKPEHLFIGVTYESEERVMDLDFFYENSSPIFSQLELDITQDDVNNPEA